MELDSQTDRSIQETGKSRFAVAATGGQSAVTYLQQIFRPLEGPVKPTPAPEPEPTAEAEFDPEPTPLEQAFSDDSPPAPGEPTVPAADEVSLASVFDGSVPASPPAEVAPDAGDGVSYDEFYGASAPDSSSTDSEGDEDSADDDDNFKNWLKGLKT
jgi:hypothetical protein